MSYDQITWVDCQVGGKPYTAAELLKRAKDDGAAWVASHHKARSLEFTPHKKPNTTTGEEQTYDGWLRDEVGNPVMSGLRLLHLPWGPAPRELITALTAFALDALHKIDSLADLLRERDRTIAAERKRHDVQTDAFNTEISERDAREAAFRRDLHDECEAHAATRRSAATEADALARDLAEAREEARIAASERDLARQQAEAWRASSDASAQALAILRAALRIPDADDGAMVRR